MNQEFGLLIDGKWRNGSDNRFGELINPATEQVIGRVAYASQTDVDLALAAAKKSFFTWRDTPVSTRVQILNRAATLLYERIDAAAVLLTCEQGKPLTESRQELIRAAETIAWNAEQAERILESRSFPERDYRRFIVPEPIGVVAAFTPWNYPAVVSARKIAPALAAGCTIILKAAEETPSSAVAIATALIDAGLPPGVINLVFGDPPVISQHLLASPIIRKLSFTGSTAVGKQLAKLAADHLVRCTLELGGHAPVIVFADADVDAAAGAIAAYKFKGCGQSCNAPSRIYVHESLYQPFLKRFAELVQKIRVGDGMDENTDMGPMANSRRIAAMERLVADAVAKGGRIVTGGKRLGKPGYFFLPTILTEVPKDAAIMNEEPFGPVIPIVTFADFDEAIHQANSNPYGLAAYVFTSSPIVAEAAAKALEVGSVGINQLSGVPPNAPVGGVKDSGYGYEGGIEGLEAFLNLKLLSYAI
ncbi:NAD-dependent succinate-semialdehyde dehydrogenase [Nostoc sp. 2RC]|uniref:NAD-dependent succinate-semialdehyde dehydrogenase n=1 Tax=Nostoc sp. 2RC TaxID=2485484 RepID=UPI001623960C|nr:NAD-dependent succinate-semialdehyde dehydrogenase [Nostoc sp. 2RC]MBC1241046.1 NAD-dependent succinate-semialdehyde dehydrogenase [Nostoc sp. 2RC]